MTFLNPLVLFGLIAAAIPVVLHLLNLRKLRTIEFSTLKFLKELQQTKIRRLKLRQIILLITRTLLVIFIVLAFARPALRGTILGNIGSNAHSTTVFILDDSFSMLGSDEHGEYFKQAKDRVGTLIKFLKDGDEAYLIKLSDLPEATINPATHDFEALATIIKESHVVAIRRSIDDAIILSAKLLDKSKNANKEVYIISDMQKTLFTQQFNKVKNKNTSFFDERLQFFFIPIGTKEIANTSIDSITIATTIIEKDKPVNIIASVINFRPVPINNYVVNAYLDGIKTVQKNIDIEPWGAAVIALNVTPKRTGYINGYIELENDALENDNRRYFTIYVPDKINLTLVDNKSTDNRFIFFALNSTNSDSGKSLFKIQEIPVSRFQLTDLQKTDVLVLSDIKSFSQDDADRVRAFVENGGGLIIFPGDNISIENYNSTLFSKLDLPPIDALTNPVNSQYNLSFQMVDYNHPIFATMFEKENAGSKKTPVGVESPNISKSIHQKAGRNSRTIISLSNNTPFLSEYNFGKGKILFFSVAPLSTWSDFPFKGIFAPLMYRSMIYVTSNENNNTNLITSDEPIIHSRVNSVGLGDKQFSIILPDGTDEKIQPVYSTAKNNIYTRALTFEPKRLSLPGFYEIKQDKNSILSFSVNTDRLESDPRKNSPDDIINKMKQYGISTGHIHFSKSNEPLETTIIQSRFGIELWKYCIGAALLLALIEMLIARDSRKASAEI